MRPANERQRYIVTLPLIDWAHTQNDPCNWHIEPWTKWMPFCIYGVFKYIYFMENYKTMNEIEFLNKISLKFFWRIWLTKQLTLVEGLRLWLGAIKHQAITWPCVELQPWHHMASLGYKKSNFALVFGEARKRYIRTNWKKYCQTSNISHTKSPNLNVCLILQLSLPNPLKPGVKLRMKMWLEQCRQAMLQPHMSDQQYYCILNKVWLILEVWQ